VRATAPGRRARAAHSFIALLETIIQINLNAEFPAIRVTVTMRSFAPIMQTGWFKEARVKDVDCPRI
jgi:hypothetical protein